MFGEKGTAVLAVLTFMAMALIAAYFKDPESSGAVPVRGPLRVVCDANVEPIEFPESGQYGKVTAQACYRETFHGEKVLVLFVD